MLSHLYISILQLIFIHMRNDVLMYSTSKLNLKLSSMPEFVNLMSASVVRRLEQEKRLQTNEWFEIPVILYIFQR